MRVLAKFCSPLPRDTPPFFKQKEEKMQRKKKKGMSLFFWCVFIFKYTCVHVSLATLLCTSFFLLSCCFFPLFPPSFACSQCWLAQLQRICHVWLVFCSGKWRDQKVNDGFARRSGTALVTENEASNGELERSSEVVISR